MLAMSHLVLPDTTVGFLFDGDNIVGKRRTPENYHALAESKGLEWVGGFPPSTITKTKWKCSDGHIWMGKFNDIQNGHGCPYCAGVARKVEKDYHNLAHGRGFVWIGKENPPNTKTKTTWCCSSGHIWETTYGGILSGAGCPICYGNLPKTAEDYYMIAAEKGIEWIGKKLPKNNKAKTSWRCPYGHIWRTSYGLIHRGRGCPICANRVPKTSSDYYAIAKERGFSWLGPGAQNTGDKTWWECKKGHQWEQTYNSIQQGSGCPFCARKVPKIPSDYHALAARRGYKWLGPKVPTIKNKTQWKCGNGHVWETSYASIRKGCECLICSGRMPKTPQDYFDIAAKCGYTWLGPEVSSVHMKTWWKCAFSHIWEAPYNNIKCGSGCPDCANEAQSRKMKRQWASGAMDGVFQSPTSIEIAISDALDRIGIEHQSQYRPCGYSRTFDEFIPGGKVVIEVQGDYWHGPERPGQQKKDAKKARWAKVNGYCLVALWEHEIREYGAEALIRERILPLL